MNSILDLTRQVYLIILCNSLRKLSSFDNFPKKLALADEAILKAS